MNTAEALPLGTPRAQVIALLGEYRRLDGLHEVGTEFLVGRLHPNRRGACDEKWPHEILLFASTMSIEAVVFFDSHGLATCVMAGGS